MAANTELVLHMMIANKRIPMGLAALLAVVLLVGGCGKDGASPADGETAAARDNVDAMSREHADDTTDPSPAAWLAPRRAVESDPRMPYAELGDDLVYGYFAAPADVVEPLPALILIHEWWGLNDNIRAVADRLAGEGYMVLAVDMYGGRIASNASEARQLMLEVVEEPELANENIRSAYQFLEEVAGAPKIGSLGWCFGGGWSLNTARLFPADLDASVIYYGRVTADEEILRPVNAPILGLFGAEDTGIPVASVEAFGDSLERLRKDYEIYIYPDVGHAFANPSGRNYDEDAATDAWNKTLEFLARHLSGSPGSS